MKYIGFVLVFFIFFSGASRFLPGQDVNVVEMKKKEEERRKKTQKTKVSITDDNINSIAVPNRSYSFLKVESESALQGTAAGGEAEASTVEPGGEAASADETKTPEYWKTQKKATEDRIRELRDGIARDELALNKLWTDFYVQGKADQQLQLRVQISQLSSQIENNKDFLKRAESDLNTLFERARKGGIPPGWMR
jgi:hypothetical protein